MDKAYDPPSPLVGLGATEGQVIKIMEKSYDHNKYEGKIYKKWEEGGAFAPEINPEGKPFTIILPPPNCNGELHLGNALYTIEDILIRFKRMQGYAALWVPGTDHAGILTQAVFERKLHKESGKTRYDLGRKEFQRQIYEFAINAKKTIEGQLRAMGFSLDWSRNKFTLDPAISKIVLETFTKLYKDGLVYRGSRLVNWCWRCRTTLSDLETEEKEQEDKLYFLDYGTVTVATTRPETIFADTAIAVNPKDKRFLKIAGKKAVVPIINREILIITDEAVELGFGTGALKVTPGHDMTDYEIGERHSLPVLSVIDFDGRMTGEIPDELKGLKIKEAREKVIIKLQELGKLVKTEPFRHSIKTCERCKTVIEPLISRQWFIKMKPLAETAIEAVKEKRIKLVPARWYNQYYLWMENLRDWPVSRQIWWGQRMPVYYCVDCQTEEGRRQAELIKQDSPIIDVTKLEKPMVAAEKPEKCENCGGYDVVQDPDTFDTWFSSGQWPFTTLKTTKSGDFEKFYPTSVLDTGWEIFWLWVTRMIMFGLYIPKKVPFENVLVHGMLRDEKGQKMSKSKGNGINPLEMIAKYGADATRMGLVAARDVTADWMINRQQLEEKIRGYRNFANKIWNVARYVESIRVDPTTPSATLGASDKWILGELEKLIKSVTENLEKYRVGNAAEGLYEFIWHKFADIYIEKTKDRKEEASPTLHRVLSVCLKLLHPFMPFVTEAVWGELNQEQMLINTRWPMQDGS